MRMRLEEVKAVLLKLLRKRKQDSRVPALVLWGPPGVGKSRLVRQVARKLRCAALDVRLSLLNPVDLRGVPVVNRESGETLFLDEIVNCPPAVQSAAVSGSRAGES